MRNASRQIVWVSTAFGLVALVAGPVWSQDAAPAPEAPVEVPAAEVPAEVPATEVPAEAPPAEVPLAEPGAEVPVPLPADVAPTEPVPEVPVPTDVAATTAPAATAPASQPAVPATAPAPVNRDEAMRQQMLAQATAESHRVMAEHITEQARSTIRQLGVNDEAGFHIAIPMLKAATKLHPTNPRIWQLLYEAESQVGNTDGVLAALQGFRKADPYDRVSQIQLVELYASRIETADDELKYLKGVAAKETVPFDVRAHVGVMVAQRLLDRGEPQAALAALDEAFKQNPFHVAGLDLKYRLTRATATPAERAETLLMSVRANPVRPATLGEMGRLLADVGLTREALDWMKRGLDIYGRQAKRDNVAFRSLIIDYFAEQAIAGQIQGARTGLAAYLENNKDDIDGWLLRLVIERAGGDKDAYAAALQGAGEAMNAQWSAVAARAAGGPAPDAAAPTTAPVAAEPGAVAEQVKASGDEALHAAFVSAASDLAWFELFFNQQPAAAQPWVTALEAVLPADSSTLQRLSGWLQISGGQPDGGRAALNAIKDTDPLAMLGILLLDANVADPDARKASDDRARKLLQDNPSGVLGAILSQALKDRGLKPEAHPDAAAVRAAVQKLPRGWLEMAISPQRFYSVRVDADRVAYGFGEPIYGTVVIKNLSNEPITIGEDGIIQPTLWFQYKIQMVKALDVPGVELVRFTGSTIIPPKSEVGQRVRLDAGNLGALLGQDPTPRIQLTGFCTTNLVVDDKGGMGPGLGGSKVPFARKMTRTGVEVRKEKTFEELFRKVEEGLPEERMYTISMLTQYLQRFAAASQQQELNEQQRAQNGAMASTVGDKLVVATESEFTPVAQWAKFALARAIDPVGRVQMVQSLMTDKAWEGRLLGLAAIIYIPDGAARKELVSKFVENPVADEDPNVAAFANELLAFLQRPPAATQPAEGAPTTAPADGAPTTPAQ